MSGLPGESFVSKALSERLSGLAVGSPLDTDAPSFHADVCAPLERFLPAVLRRAHDFWNLESLDGFLFTIARKNGPTSAEFLGLALLIGVQEWTAVDLQLELGAEPELVKRIACKLGEPGSGVGGLSTVAYGASEVTRLLAELPGRRDRIDWVFRAELER